MPRKAKSKILEYQNACCALFDLFTEDELEIIMKHGIPQRLRKGDVLYNEGDTPSYLFCLIEGKVKITKMGASGRHQIVRMAKPVDYLGYRAAFANQQYVTKATAFENSLVVKIPIGILMHLMPQNGKVCWFFLQRLAIGLGNADARIVNLTQKHVQGRLAEALLFLKTSYGLEEDGCTLSVYLSREELSNLSNMTTANAIRTLSLFAQEKLVAVDGKKLKLIDIPALERLSKIG